MLTTQAFTDLRNYIKRRISYAAYTAGGTTYKTSLSDISILSDGTVRAQIVINTDGTSTVKITKVALYNQDAQLWASQSVNVTLSSGQANLLFWFDFTIKEES
ncbi:MAG: hypothetical protein LIO57_09070 [Oscillospiraceae bacterium]|nr:hypothetical protein [Oscillospiraceae bacterium]